MTDFLIDDTLDFEDEDTPQPGDRLWPILIVDDEPTIHEVTRFALNEMVFEGRKLDFISAFSGQEAREILSKRNDITLVLLDVVMESDTEGLQVARWIREELDNQLIRIILRTGQPGQAPERSVIMDYDINDYKDKSELTAQKLYSCVVTGIRSFRDISALYQNRIGLRRVIEASSNIFQERYLREFATGALQQLTALLHLEANAALVATSSLAAIETNRNMKVIAAAGDFEDHVDKDPADIVPEEVLSNWMASIDASDIRITDTEIIVSFTSEDFVKSLLYLKTDQPISQDSKELIRLFTQNVSIAYENMRLNQEVEDTQQEIISLLSGAVETRSKETAFHITRVSKISALLAHKYGLDDDQVNAIKLSSPLHDIGKIGIPDQILNKPGKHDADEWEIMKTHAALGAQILSGSKRSIIRSGAVIAQQHHEKWDGSGYPNALAGENIHVFGRITALADVFDALCSRRCYKEAWTTEDALNLIKKEAGRHFDPQLVELLMANLDEVLDIMERYKDE